MQSVSHHCHLSSVLSLTATAAASNHGQPSGLRLTIDTLVTTHNLRLNYHLSLLVKVKENVACLVYNMTLYNSDYHNNKKDQSNQMRTTQMSPSASLEFIYRVFIERTI